MAPPDRAGGSLSRALPARPRTGPARGQRIPVRVAQLRAWRAHVDDRLPRRCLCARRAPGIRAAAGIRHGPRLRRARDPHRRQGLPGDRRRADERRRPDSGPHSGRRRFLHLRRGGRRSRDLARPPATPDRQAGAQCRRRGLRLRPDRAARRRAGVGRPSFRDRRRLHRRRPAPHGNQPPVEHRQALLRHRRGPARAELPQHPRQRGEHQPHAGHRGAPGR